MLGILALEFKGFTKIAEELAFKMERINISSERIRAASINIINDIIAKTKKEENYLSVKKIGGDTWYFKFEDLESAIKYGCLLLNNFLELANKKGIYYLKPSVAINIGEPKTYEENFLDDMSIRTYFTADKGLPYTIYIIDEAITEAKNISWLKIIDYEIENNPVNNNNNIKFVDWQNSINPLLTDNINFDFTLPTFLLDGEVIFSNTAQDGISNIMNQQDNSESVFAFGGPVSVNSPYFSSYIAKTINNLETKPNFKIYVLSYIPLNEPLNSYTWLEMCKRINIKYPKKFNYTAFIIEQSQLRPFSYHIYDDEIVHVGLRTYSPEKGTPTMSSAIMFRNKQIALSFKNEFLENWRSIEKMDEIKLANIIVRLDGLTDDIKQKAYLIVDNMLSK